MKGMVMTMKMSIPILILFVLTQFAFAQPGGKPHKVIAYDYHDYTNNTIVLKTFNRYEGDPVKPLQEDWSFDRSVPGQVVRTEITSVSGSDPVVYTRCMINIFQPTASALNWIQNNQCNPYVVPPETTDTREYDSPVPIATSAMIPGVAWGSGVVMKRTDLNGTLPDGYYVDKNEILGVEDITVPAGTYTDCLKIHRVRYEGGNYSRIDWVCPNMGVVKRVQGGNRMLELRSVE